MNKMNMMNKTAALIAITSSVLLTACIFENQPTGESATETSLQTKGTTSPSVTTQNGTSDKNRSSSAASDHSTQLPETEVHKDSLGHDALGHDSLGHDALGHDSLGHETLGHDALGHDSVETASKDLKETPVSVPATVVGSQISHKNSGGKGVDNTTQVEKVEKVEKPEDTASVYYGIPVSN